jgi:diguanylate cyclase (GGDEF)-like protein/PAS domain S-box-containing protein
MERPTTRILLVEDNPGDARLLEEALLEEKGFDFHLEKAGKLSEGLRLLAQENTDLVLLDLYLPDSDGPETLQQVREAFPQVPIVVLTGLNDKATAVRSLQQGAQDFLMKGELDGALLSRTIRHSLERHQLLRQLTEREERYSLTALGANDGLWDWDILSGRIYFSPRWKAMFGFDEAEIGDRPEEWFNRVHRQDLARVREELDRCLSGRISHYSNEHRLRHKDGNWRWVLSRGQAIFNRKREATRIAGSFTDITAHKELEWDLALRAFYDPLTQLPNRRLFMESLKKSITRFSQNPGTLFAVLFLDLDRLKFVNDSMGHQAGDQLLLEFGKRLKASVRPNDLVARIGGDEFTAFLDGLGNQGEARAAADRILSALREPFLIGGTQVFSSASIGIAYSDCGRKTADELVRAADTAMYQAKISGKARYEIFTEEMARNQPESLKLEADLRQAIHRNEFINFYEPIIDLKTGQVAGAEVKLRWNHPQRGLLLPADFVPLAEEIGFMGAIDFISLKTAFLQNQIWHSLNPEGFFISVTFSPQQLDKEKILERLIRNLLEESGLPPRALELQLPGRWLAPENPRLPEKLMDIARLGVGLTLDHFDPIYSNIQEISESMIYKVKMGQALVQRWLRHPAEIQRVRSAVTDCHGFHIKAAATGVENHHQAKFLQRNGWDECQGPLFSQPLPADRLTKLLVDHQRLTA